MKTKSLMRLDSLSPNAYYDMVTGMPSTLERDNDGTFVYRYNVCPQVDKEGKQTGWQCREIRLAGEPTQALLKRALVRSVFGEDEEFALMNAYNRYVLGIDTDSACVQAYKEYLLFTREVEKMIEQDLPNR